jgi:allantoinase
MRYDLVVRSRRAVLPDGTRAAAVAVRGPVIATIEDYDAPLEAGREIDLGDLALLPGLVDTHVHVNEPGRTEWEGFATATRAAAAGGVTTICDMPLNSLPPTTSVAALEEKRAAAAGKCWVDVAFWGGAVPGNEASLRPLHEAGVVGFKCFLLDSGVPEFPPLDAAGLRTALGTLAQVDALLIAHAEDAAEIKDMKPGSGRDFGSFVASRPPVAERRAIEKVISAAAATGARAHIVHLSAAECVAMISGAKAAGVRLTAETCPHYLYFAAEQVPDGATEFKSCPPIRDSVNREALWLRGVRRGLGWHRLASARPVRGVDGCPAPRPDAGRHGRVDGVRPGRARGPAGQGTAGGRVRRGPGGLRPRRDVHRGPRHAAAQAPGHPVRREDADRTREADVAARHAAAGRCR